MSAERALDSRIEDALDELKETIRRRYPDARFRLGTNPEDSAIVELVTIVDAEDADQVLDVVVDRQMELQIDEGLPIFVVTERSWERVKQMLEEARARKATDNRAM